LTALLTTSLASLTIPAILSDINLDETASTPPRIWLNHSLRKPSLLKSKPFVSPHFFLAFSRSNILFVVVTEVVSIVISPSKGLSGSFAVVVITGENGICLRSCMDVRIVAFEI
jgi:hypothetical protein